VESVARFLLAIAALCEAEGLMLRRQLLRLIAAAALGVFTLGLLAVGLVLLLIGLFRMLAGPLTPTGAALALGGVSMLLGWVALVCASRLLRGKAPAASGRAPVSLAQTKAALIDAARAADPLEPMRRRPFISLGVAAAVGAALGMNGRQHLAAVRLGRTLTPFSRLVTLLVRRWLAETAPQPRVAESLNFGRRPGPVPVAASFERNVL